MLAFPSLSLIHIYYMGISANQIIKTDPVVVTVTNVFDDWSTYLSLIHIWFSHRLKLL